MGALAFFAAIGAAITSPIWGPTLFWRLHRPNTTARAVAELFALCPDEWVSDEHYATHTSGLYVWIASKASFVRVKDRHGREAAGFRSCPGGNQNQRLVWRAYTRWLASRPAQPDAVEAAAARALDACRAHQATGGEA